MNSRSSGSQRRHINNLQTTERPASPVMQIRSPTGTAKDEAAYLESDKYANFKRWQKLSGYGLNQIGPGGDLVSNDGPRTKLNIGGAIYSVLIDTGSPVNVFDEITFKKMKPKPTLYPCCTKYYGYTADTPINIIGQFITEVTVGNRCTKAAFVVIKGKNECLLSFRTAQQLKTFSQNSI